MLIPESILKSKFGGTIFATEAMKGHLGGLVVECLPLAQGVILGSWDRVLHRAPCEESASPSVYVSASFCVSHE